jgi:hypothetical protein
MKGIVDFVCDRIIKLEDGTQLYICCDYSRKIFKYNDINGKENTDPNAYKLAKMIKDKLYEKTRILYTWFEDNYKTLKNREDRGCLDLEDRKELNLMYNMKNKADNTIKIIDCIDIDKRFGKELANKLK